MKRINAFYITRQKRVKDLTKQLQTIEVQQQRIKLKKIISERKNKWREALANKQLNHPNFVYLKRGSGEFSFVESNASKEPFISERDKILNFQSNRALSSSPNMKAGNPYNSIKNPQEIEDKIVLNKKFMQYSRIIDQNSALKKIQAMDKLKSKSILYDYPRKRVTQMKRTFFQKMVPDKVNFYTINDYHAIKSTSLSHSKTDIQLKSENQLLSKLRRVSSTIQTEMGQKGVSSLQQLVLRKSRSKSKRLIEFQSYKSQSDAKSRIKSQGSQILLPISFHKNLDSIQN